MSASSTTSSHAVNDVLKSFDQVKRRTKLKIFVLCPTTADVPDNKHMFVVNNTIQDLLSCFERDTYTPVAACSLNYDGLDTEETRAINDKLTELDHDFVKTMISQPDLRSQCQSAERSFASMPIRHSSEKLKFLKDGVLEVGKVAPCSLRNEFETLQQTLQGDKVLVTMIGHQGVAKYFDFTMLNEFNAMIDMINFVICNSARLELQSKLKIPHIVYDEKLDIIEWYRTSGFLWMVYAYLRMGVNVDNLMAQSLLNHGSEKFNGMKDSSVCSTDTNRREAVLQCICFAETVNDIMATNNKKYKFPSLISCGFPAEQLSKDVLDSKSAKQLKYICLQRGVDASKCLEKKELVELILSSY